MSINFRGQSFEALVKSKVKIIHHMRKRDKRQFIKYVHNEREVTEYQVHRWVTVTERGLILF